MQISIITSSYQGSGFIDRCYYSLSNQSWADWEWVFVDDCSSDDTGEKIRKLNDPRIKYLRLNHNLGRGEARNIALANATGKWVAIQDVDDLSTPDRLQAAVEAEKRGASFLCSSLLLIDWDYNLNGIRRFDERGYPRQFTHASLCGNTEIIRKIGYPKYQRAQDVTLVLTIANHFIGEFHEMPYYIYHENANGSLRDAWLGQYFYLRQLNDLLRSGVLRSCGEIHLMRRERVGKMMALLPLFLAPKVYSLGRQWRDNMRGETLTIPQGYRDFIVECSVRFPMQQKR